MGGKKRDSMHRPSTTPKKLAPLDHIKNLYDGAAANLKGENRKIFQKKDLVDAVREMNSNMGLNRMLNSASDSALALVHKDTNQSKKKSSNQERSKSPTPSTKRKKLPVVDINNSRTQMKTARELLQESLNFNSKKYNEYKVACETKERVLDKMIDELAGLQVENESLRKMELHQTQDTHRIDELNDQIAEATDTLEERQHRRNTLQHMKKRLEMNQFAFDAHIKGMEEALNASSREFEEVKLLMRQLETGNANAQEVLKTTAEKVQKERDFRNKHLSQRRQEAANAKRMEEWRAEREKARMVLDAEMRGDLSEEGEKELIAAVEQSENHDQELEKLHQKTTQAVSTYEEAFAAIREATGVRTLDEMVEKFLGQSANKNALLEEKLEAEQRQQKVKEDLARVQTEFSEFKSAGLGGSELNREMYDKLDNDILEARHELKIKQAVNTRLDKILIQIRAGMLGLLSRLAPFKQALNFEDDANAPRSGIEVLDLTLSCEAKLMKLLDSSVVNQVAREPRETLTNDDGAAAAAANATEATSTDLVRMKTLDLEPRKRGKSLSVLEEASQMTHVNNIRVRPRKVYGNGDVGTPLSTARSEFDDDEDDRSETAGELLLMDGKLDEEEEYDDREGDSDDDSGVYDAAALKKAARVRVQKALDDRRSTMKRNKTLNGIKGRKGKDRVNSLAKPAKHRQKRGQAPIFDKPELF